MAIESNFTTRPHHHSPGVNEDGGARLDPNGSSEHTTQISQQQTADADATNDKSAAMASQGRLQALYSIATKQADAQTARNAKQSEAMGQI